MGRLRKELFKYEYVYYSIFFIKLYGDINKVKVDPDEIRKIYSISKQMHYTQMDEKKNRHTLTFDLFVFKFIIIMQIVTGEAYPRTIAWMTRLLQNVGDVIQWQLTIHEFQQGTSFVGSM
jgi:hypothetical protein